MLSSLEPSSFEVKWFICVTNYLYLSVMYYRRMMQSSQIFQDFRQEATAFIYRYQPQGLADLNLLLYNSLLIIHTWKNESVIEPEGLLLVASLKHRFPAFREWEAVGRLVKTKFGYLVPILAEWEDSWSQSSSA